jgi:hypothetical protein
MVERPEVATVVAAIPAFNRRRPNKSWRTQLEALRILIAKTNVSPFWIPALG